MIDEPATRSECSPRGNAVIASRELTQERRSHRSHSACLRSAGFGTFEQSNAFFQHRNGRVLQTRIGHALRVTCKPVCHGLRVIIGVTGCEEQRFAGLSVLAAPGSTTHSLCRGAPIARSRAVHACCFLHCLAGLVVRVTIRQ